MKDLVIIVERKTKRYILRWHDPFTRRIHEKIMRETTRDQAEKEANEIRDRLNRGIAND